jgi:2,3-bisphosphoglycerate-independent phosphoglycerate mutase
MFKVAKEGTRCLYLAGLILDRGVYSKQDHLYALLRVTKEMEIPYVYIYLLGDGGDSNPKSGAGYMQELLNKIIEIGISEVATVVRRYYTIDRDERWERIEVALKDICLGNGEESSPRWRPGFLL